VISLHMKADVKQSQVLSVMLMMRVALLSHLRHPVALAGNHEDRFEHKLNHYSG
jgi:hypothetical protein